jgi:hypothetical protein
VRRAPRRLVNVVEEIRGTSETSVLEGDVFDVEGSVPPESSEGKCVDVGEVLVTDGRGGAE